MKKLKGIAVILYFIFAAASVFASEPKMQSHLLTNTSSYVYSLPSAKADISSVHSVKSAVTSETSDNSLNLALLPFQSRFSSHYANQENIIYRESYRTVNAINPKKNDSPNSYYPGQRGPNQLIIYTPLYGIRTGTNEFGTEAVVVNNMVVALTGADSSIPRSGFVISGHGSAKNWIQKNIQIGSKVYIDYPNKTVKVFLTPESLLFAAKEKLKDVNELVRYYQNSDILYNDRKAVENLENSKNLLRKAEKKPDKTQDYITCAMESLDKAIKNAIPYKNEELKGIWIRPVEKSRAEIEKTVSRIADSGITDIFLETYFHGKTIYPSKYLKENGVISQRPEFIGFDPLEIWMKEAHKRKMKVHIWFETFYVGNDNPQDFPRHVLNIYPSWANKRLNSCDSDIPVPSLSEHNGYFLDPANKQVNKYLLGIINEIITVYNPDGINLDYVRYPQTVDTVYPNYVSTNWGYTKTARAEFYSLYGIDPVNIKYGTKEWDMWSIYRQNKISDFISQVSQLTRPKNILLTAVVFPDLKKSKATKMQNWQTWSEKNYVDGLTPLLLTGNRNTAVSLLKDVVYNTAPRTKLYPGLFVTFMGGTFDELLIQIQKTREFKTHGNIMFDYAHLQDSYIDALTARVYNKSYDENEARLKEDSVIKESQEIMPPVNNKEKKKRKSRRKKHD